MSEQRLRMLVEGQVFWVEPPFDMPQAAIEHYSNYPNFPDIPAPPPPADIEFNTPPQANIAAPSSLFPPGFLVPSSGITPGPFPPPVPAYTRKVAQALARERDLEERGILVYMEDVVQAVKKWMGFAEVETDEEDYEWEEEQEVVLYRPFIHRVFEFLFRTLLGRRRW